MSIQALKVCGVKSRVQANSFPSSNRRHDVRLRRLVRARRARSLGLSVCPPIRGHRYGTRHRAKVTEVLEPKTTAYDAKHVKAMQVERVDRLCLGRGRDPLQTMWEPASSAEL